ncbi:MAG: hypothetical protein ABJP48_04215 [Erythrobacter sp.]
MSIRQEWMRKRAIREDTRADNVERAERKAAASIAAHRIFVPMISAWGAALGGLTLAVLPAATIAKITTLMQLGILGTNARLVLALFAALFAGLIAFAIARAIRTSAEQKTLSKTEAAFSADALRPIDPGTELGSESLDAPIDEEDWHEEEQPEETEFESDELLELGEEQEFEPERFGDFEEAANAQDLDDDVWFDPPAIAPEFDHVTATGDELDEAAFEPLELGEFPQDPEIDEALPEDLIASDNPESPIGDEHEFELELNPATIVEDGHDVLSPAAVPDIFQESAIERLRRIPTDELSLVQMVERFAAALHEHADVHGPAGQPRRDAALAESLRALSLLSDGPRASSERDGSDTAQNEDRTEATERELRDALAKLQQLSGAA